MTKKMISWLSFMAVFLFLLHSCVHDEIYSSSDPASGEYHSKSLWKEDALFIGRIYDHFQKSFMPTSEEESKFITQYGTPFWEYAMTMGFGKKQVYVPLVVNNHVTGMMRVIREDKKAFYSFTNDAEVIQFFETVIYNPDNDELQPQKDEKLGKTTSKAGGYTWTCTKRVVITGWHMEGDTMIMESSLVEVCKYTYTGMNPAVDTIEVYTDGMESGGGEDDLQNPQTPCEKTKNILNNPELQSAITKMKNQAALPVSAQNYGEIGYKFKADGTSSGMISGGKNEVELGPEAGYQGGYHNHPLMGIKMLSPDDIVKLLNFAMAQPNGNIADAFMGMIGTGADGTEYHYLIQYTGNMQELQQYLYSNNLNLDQLKNDFAKMEDELLSNSLYISYSTGKLNNQGLEKLFFGTLKNMGLENKVNLQRIESNVIKNVTLNSNGTTTANSCPQN